jgi:RimJ/RimL family protein N-acetyltransferase
MLRLDNYGIALRQITVYDLETLREWRNSDLIAQYMTFQGHISREMQLRWYEEVAKRGDLYLIIQYNNKEIGLTGAKHMSEYQCEAHGYIYDPAYQNSHVAYRSTLLLYDYLFDMYNVVTCKIRKHNTRSQKFNKSLGYEIAIYMDGVDDQTYILTKERYSQYTKRFKMLLK